MDGNLVAGIRDEHPLPHGALNPLIQNEKHDTVEVDGLDEELLAIKGGKNALMAWRARGGGL